MRPAKILVQLVPTRVYQRISRWKRRVHVYLQLSRVPGWLPFNNFDFKVTVTVASRDARFYWSYVDKERMLRILEDQYTETKPMTINEADTICDHVFELLGSGRVHLGHDIAWNRDFKSGHRWSPGFYADIVQVPSGKQADVKVPRELSRCHHFVTLGRAYWYTRDEKYARQFVAQLTDWIGQNPPWMTINWCSAMDVAIRLVNWIWAYHFFKDSPHFEQQKQTVFLKSVLSHAQFVAENLEYYGELSDNHYVSNVVGLAIVGTLFPEFKQATKWQRTGLKGMFSEIFSQVHEDGVHFEGSINYHRLVLEMFVSGLILCRKNSIEIPEPVWSRLEKMFEFMLHYLKPDGTAPQIGDTDNGRLQVLSSDKTMDHQYLLAVGAVLFDRSDFKAAVGSFPEEAFWLLGEEGLKTFEAIGFENI